MRAYQQIAHQGWVTAVTVCTLAAGVDAIITVLVYVGISRLCKGLPQAIFLSMISCVAAATAVTIERFGLALGSWSYARVMPVIPVLNVGLWPVLQLAMLVPASIYVTSRHSVHRAP